MGLQIYSENKTPTQIQFEIEQELIGVNPHYFERDKETILDIYKSIFLGTGQIPRIAEIEQQVAELNYDVCYKVSIIEFEYYYEQDAIGSMLSFYNCSSTGELEQYIDMSEVFISEIDYLAREMFEDVCSSQTREIEEFIQEALDCLEVVYEDDTDYNPICSEILFNRDEHMIIVNDAQITMFPGLHADEYGYENNTVYDDFENIKNCTVQRRRRGEFSNLKLLQSGGD